MRCKTDPGRDAHQTKVNLKLIREFDLGDFFLKEEKKEEKERKNNR